MLLNVGQMAEANGVSAKTLRLYQERGILQPDSVDEQTGYRHYCISQSAKLDLVTQLQHIGCTLSEISEVSQHKSIEFLRQTLQVRRQELCDEIVRLESMKRAADSFIENCDTFLTRTVCNQIVTEKLSQRYALTFPIPTAADLGGGGDFSNFERWAWHGCYIKRRIAERGWPATLFRNAGCLVDPADAPFFDGDAILRGRPYVVVDEQFALYHPDDVELLDAGNYLVVYLDVDHPTTPPSVNGGWCTALMEYAAQKHYEVTGPLSIEGILHARLFFDKDACGFYRMAIPVKK